MSNDIHSYVEVLSWYHPEHIPAQHLALLIRNENQIHYLSFAPKIARGRPRRSIFQLQQGVDALFINNYEDELLIRGFRNAWPNIKDSLQPVDQQFIAQYNFREISDIEILSIARELPTEQQAELQKSGRPTEVIELRSLNIEAMIQKMAIYKQNTLMKWSFWSGTDLHAANTHNCASIVLDLLYTGGISDLIPCNRDLLTIAGIVLGASYVLVNSPVYLETITEVMFEIVKGTGIGLIAGRGLGGFLEGYTGVQSFLNLRSVIKKDDSIINIFGLRVLCASLSAFIGLVKQGPIVPSFLTMPREVLNLVYQAKIEEENIFSFSIAEHSAACN